MIDSFSPFDIKCKKMLTYSLQAFATSRMEH